MTLSPDDVVVASELELDAVTLVNAIAGINQVVDVVVLDDAIKKLAGIKIAPKIKGFALGTRVVDFVIDEIATPRRLSPSRSPRLPAHPCDGSDFRRG